MAMNTPAKPRVVDAHMHLYDNQENRYEHMEHVDAMLKALLGDYSTLPKRHGRARFTRVFARRGR